MKILIKGGTGARNAPYVRELDDYEQIRMSIDEAGALYNGYAIIFTNTEDTNGDCSIDYGIPRIIGESMPACAKSEFIKKYYDANEYGPLYYCLQFISADAIPPVLLAKG